MARCTEELIWLNEREEEEIAFDWSDNNPNLSAKRELYSVRSSKSAHMNQTQPLLLVPFVWSNLRMRIVV